MFHVGQEVVCIDDTDVHKYLCKGQKYVIEEVYESKGCTWVSLIGVASHIPLPHRGWYPRRFRPLTRASTSTGMAILHKIADEASRGLETVR